jgi:transient receptor potential cation channel subfamily A member 1
LSEGVLKFSLIFVLKNTALHLATMENKPNAIVLLLSIGCKLLYNKSDLSAIDYAIYFKYPEAALAMVTHPERYFII